MKVIVGLGNPGGQYAETRHNIGFVVVDSLAEELKLEYRSKFQGLLGEGKLDGEKIFLLKPQTYMNLSGRSVRELANFMKIPVGDILTIHDDMDLPFGKMRLRSSGSPGGHNGIRSIIGELGTEEFWRLKIGVGRPPHNWDPARYVLAPFVPEELKLMDDIIDRALKAIRLWALGESTKAMNLYNR